MTAAEKGDDRVSDKHASQHGDIYHNGSCGFGGKPDIAEMNCNRRSVSIWRLRLGRGSMLCAPILHSLGGDSFIRTNNAIDGMAFK